MKRRRNKRRWNWYERPILTSGDIESMPSGRGLKEFMAARTISMVQQIIRYAFFLHEVIFVWI